MLKIAVRNCKVIVGRRREAAFNLFFKSLDFKLTASV